MKKANKRLIDDWGRIPYGVLDTPVDVINYRDFDLRTVMDKPRSALARKARFNQFQFVSAMAPGWVFGLAVVDLKLVSTAFFYLYDFKTGQMLEQSLTQPLAMGTHIEPRPETGVTEFRKGKTCVRIRWQGQSWQCDSLSRAAVDWSCGFMRRETAWNWASLAGVLADGRAVGLNLAAGVNETGMTENALWLEGRCIKLGQARFNAWLIASNFRQYIGTFSGTVRDEAGNSIPVDGLRGLMEDHFARW